MGHKYCFTFVGFSVQWLSIMVQLCNLKHYCVWEYAPELPRAVIALFLGRPLSGLVYCRISQLLYQIDDERAKPNSVVELIFQYIGELYSIGLISEVDFVYPPLSWNAVLVQTCLLHVWRIGVSLSTCSKECIPCNDLFYIVGFSKE